MSISEKSTNEEEYTLESVYSSVSSSASKSDELQSVATTSTQCVIENNNQNRLARLDGLPIGEGDILTVIISRSSNYTSKVCRRQNWGNNGKFSKRYDSQIDDSDDSDDSSFVNVKSSSV